jgi:hypothetical protein
MASKKQHAAIDFQGAATIKIDGATTASQYLGTTSSGNLTWLPATTTAAGMGNVGVSNYEGLIHSSLANSTTIGNVAHTNFCIAQSSTGTTVLNAASGKKLYLRTEGGTLADDSIIIDGGTLSFQGEIGSEGDVLTVNASNKAVWATSFYKTTITWPAWVTGHNYPHVVGSGTGALAYTDSGGEDYNEHYDIVKITHNLGTRGVLVDVIEYNNPLPGANPAGYYNEEYAGMDIGHSDHVIVVRDTTNTVTLKFGNLNDIGAQYRVLIQKVG